MDPNNHDGNQPDQPQAQPQPTPNPEPQRPQPFEPAPEAQPQSVQSEQPQFAPAVEPQQTEQPAVTEAAPVVGQPFAASPQQVPAQAQQPAAPKQPKKTKLVLIISSAVLALILVVAGVLLYLNITTVKPADYAKAYDAVVAVKEPTTKTPGSYAGLDPESDEARTKQLEALRKNIDEYNGLVDVVAAEKAIKYDKKAAELYAPIRDSRAAYNEAFEAAYETFEYIIPALTSNTSTGGGIAQAAAMLKEAQPKLKDDINKKAVDRIIPVLEDYTKVQERLKLDHSPGLTSEMRRVSGEMTAVMKEWQEAQTKRTNDINMTEKFDALADYLEGKSEGVKKS